MINLLFQNLTWISVLSMATCITLSIWAMVCIVDFEGFKRSVLILGSLGLIFGIVSSLNTLVKPFEIDPKYSISMNKSRTLSLYEKTPASEYAKDVSGGITVTKPKESTSPNGRLIARIQCNNLDYAECVNKIKENLNQITASTFQGNGIMVVQF